MKGLLLIGLLLVVIVHASSNIVEIVVPYGSQDYME